MASLIPVEQLAPIIEQWVATGSLSTEDSELLKADYARDFGLPGACTSCYWNTVQTHYRLLLRSLRTMKENPKYIINPEVGTSFRPFGAQKEIVNVGSGTASTEELTDKLAEKLLKNEGYKDVIIENPEYKKPEPPRQPASTTNTGRTAARTQTATTLTPQPANNAPAAAETTVSTVPTDSAPATNQASADSEAKEGDKADNQNEGDQTK